MEEVCIAGAGPTGLMMAACLSRQNIPFRIIDQKSGPSTHSKALGVQPRTLEILEGLGLVDRFLKKGNKVEAVNMYDGNRRLLHLDLTKNFDSKFKHILIVPQSETEKILLTDLQERGHAVEWNTKLLSFTQNSDSVEVKLDKETLSTKWLLGCDGAHSAVRHGLNCGFEGDAIDHYFLLADMVGKWPFSLHQLQIFFHTEGVAAIFPIDKEKGWIRLVANLPRLSLTESDKIYTQKEVEALFRKRSGLHTHVDALIWTSLFKVSYRLANKIREGRVFLLGDALHIHSPVGGQGMNTGMQDAYNLAWKLALVMKGQAGEELLQTYSDERYHNAQNLLKWTRRATQLIDSSSAIIRLARSYIAPYILPLFQHKLFNILGQLTLSYPKNPALQGDGEVGMRFRSKGALSPKFHLFIPEKEADLAEVATLAKEKLQAEVHPSCDGHPPGLYLVRPDGILGYHSPPTDKKGLEDYIRFFSR